MANEIHGDTYKMLEKKFNIFSEEFSVLLQDYRKKSRRLDKIIKLSDKQQLDMMKLNVQLDEYKNHLEQKVDEKTKELQELNKNLEQRVQEEVEANRKKDKHLHDQAKFAQLGELIGNIAHQWRQPLNAISTTISGMQAMRDIGVMDKDEEDESLKLVFETTQYLSNVINNFRDFIDQDSTKGEFVLQDIVNGAVDIIKSSLDNNAILIDVEILKEHIKIFTIPSELSQVILNILKNAQDALVKSQKEIDKKVKVKVKEDNERYIINISDNADGIDKKILPKIFDPYFTTKHQAQGTGLGLYIARETIEKSLNGTLEVKTSNDGTIFSIILLKE